MYGGRVEALLGDEISERCGVNADFTADDWVDA
jgi:hypothetical protein